MIRGGGITKRGAEKFSPRASFEHCVLRICRFASSASRVSAPARRTARAQRAARPAHSVFPHSRTKNYAFLARVTLSSVRLPRAGTGFFFVSNL